MTAEPRCDACPSPPGLCVGQIAPRHCDLHRADPATWAPVILAHAGVGDFGRAPSVAPPPTTPARPPTPADLVLICEHRKPIGCACRGDYACALYQIPATWAECLGCVGAG